VQRECAKDGTDNALVVDIMADKGPIERLKIDKTNF
jgi:hypothetical protein